MTNMWQIYKFGQPIYGAFKDVSEAIDTVYSFGGIVSGMWTNPDWIAFTDEDVQNDREATYRIIKV